MRKRRKIKPSVLIACFLMIIAGFTFVYPLVWMMLLSLKDTTELYTNPFGLPEKWLFSNYLEVGKFFNIPEAFRNSMIYSVGTVFLTILIGSMYAYCAARMQFKLSKASMSYITFGLFVPVQVVIVPLFLLLKDIGLRNTFFGLIMPYSAFSLSSSVLMFFAFFKTLPYTLEEAAVIDGCSLIRAFFRIMLPSVKPAIAMQIILVFLNTWNEFFMAYILVNDKHMMSMPVGLLNFFVSAGVNKWGHIGAAMVIASFPAVLVYILFHNQVERALTAGAVLK